MTTGRPGHPAGDAPADVTGRIGRVDRAPPAESALESSPIHGAHPMPASPRFAVAPGFSTATIATELPDPLAGLAYSPDGRTLSLGCRDGTARL